jgi:hypothetical protein
MRIQDLLKNSDPVQRSYQWGLVLLNDKQQHPDSDYLTVSAKKLEIKHSGRIELNIVFEVCESIKILDILTKLLKTKNFQIGVVFYNYDDTPNKTIIFNNLLDLEYSFTNMDYTSNDSVKINCNMIFKEMI